MRFGVWGALRLPRISWFRARFSESIAVSSLRCQSNCESETFASRPEARPLPPLQKKVPHAPSRMFQCFGSSAPRSEARLPSSTQNNGKLCTEHLRFATKFEFVWFCVCFRN